MSDTNRRKTDSIVNSLSTKELAAVLAKHFGLEAGSYELGIEFQIGVGPVGPNSEELVPGVVLGVKSVGLSRKIQDSESTPNNKEIGNRGPAKRRSKKDL